MSELERVLDIQVLDTALDQIPHRRERLPERAAHAEAAGAVAEAAARQERATARIEAATARIEELETVGTARAAKKARLEQQLKRVIAPREAEALMHEIALLDDERSTADDEELELMDVVEQASDEQDTAASDLAGAAEALAARVAELAVAEAALDAERHELLAQRAAAGARVTEGALTRYERGRASYGGVAISRLAAGRCGACHLDQSRAALDALRSAPDDALIECEQCGRLLVR